MVPPWPKLLRTVRGTRTDDADEHNSFLAFEFAEVFLEDVVLALSLLEPDQGDVLVVDEIPDSSDKRVGHRPGLLGGGKAVAEIVAEETGDAALGRELGEVGVEIHAVDAFQFIPVP